MAAGIYRGWLNRSGTMPNGSNDQDPDVIQASDTIFFHPTVKSQFVFQLSFKLYPLS